MTFLRSHNLPTTACFVLRYLASRSDGIQASDLAKLLAPPSLEGPAGKDPGHAGGFPTEHTIDGLREIDLVGSDGSKLFVVDPKRDAVNSAASDHEVLRIVRGAVFASPRLTWSRENDRWNTRGANDFLRAACWFLSQDPLGAPFAFGRKGSASDAERIQRQQFARGTAVVTNETRWADFERWACALGLGRRISLRNVFFLSPDPTDAIAEELVKVLDPGEWYSIDEVMDRLAEPLPILGTGVLRSQMLELIQAAPEGLSQRTVDPALSQAIIILAERRFLEFHALSDALEQRLLWDRPDPQSITHLRLVT